MDKDQKTQLVPISDLMGLLCYPDGAIDAPEPLKSLLSEK
jgi:hypothetical protein